MLGKDKKHSKHKRSSLFCQRMNDIDKIGL